MSTDFTEKIKEVLTANGITEKVLSVGLSDSGLRGENFGSITEYITVHFLDESREKLNLFVKKALKDTAHASMVEEIQLFKKEVAFFNKFVPEARELCKSKGAEDLLEIYPKCYYADESVLIFENLVLDKGFNLVKFGEQQDLEASKLAVINIAKHHAISNAIILKNGGVEKFKELNPIFTFDPWQSSDGLRNSMGPMLECSLTTTSAILQNCKATGAEKAIQKLKNKRGHVWEELVESLTMEDGDLLVLIHGDYHTNNMLFRKDGEGKCIAHIPVDFQLARLNTVGVDLVYHLVSSVKPDVRRDHLQELLQIYLDTLNQTADVLGVPIGMKMDEVKKYFLRSFKISWWLYYGWSNGGAKISLQDAGVDVRTVDGFEAVGQKLSEYFAKMQETDPDLCEENAKSIIGLLEEYERLENGILW